MKKKKAKKAKKKKKPSQAWKNLEKYVASFLEGIRILRGFNFSASLPDVVADGKIIGVSDVSILVECKHSKDQPFVELLKDLGEDQVLHIESEELGKLVFWNFEHTRNVILKYPYALNNLTMLRTIPKYIIDNFNQACGYATAGLIPIQNKLFRMVVIAKKNCATRIAYTTVDELNKLQQYGKLRAAGKERSMAEGEEL